MATRIISNERYLRALLSADTSGAHSHVQAQASSSRQASDKPPTISKATWKSWLVKLGSPAAELMLGKPDRKTLTYLFEREEDMSGLCLLDQKRQYLMRLGTAEYFNIRWRSQGGGVLSGLAGLE